MRYSFFKFAAVAVVCFSALTSCVMESDDVDYDEIEQLVLANWIADNAPEATYWTDGYYTIVESEGDKSTTPIHEYEDCWVRYNLTGTNLEGNVIVTRSELLAYQEGTFSRWAMYEPLYHDLNIDLSYYYNDEIYDLLPECMRLAFNNEVLNLRKGSKLTMYIPSELIDGATSIYSGFEGQYTLASYQPLRAVVEIVEIVEDPSQSEISEVETFAQNNGGLLINYRKSDGEDISDEDLAAYNEQMESATEQWSNAMDTIANVYIYRNYTPDIYLNYTNPYTSQIPDCAYNTYSISQIDSLINEYITEDYYDVFSDPSMKGEFVEYSGSCTIWYVARFLNGFIFDTNIHELKELISGETEDDTAALDYTAVTYLENANVIPAWFYAIPQLRYGQWATIITTSANAYGEFTMLDNIQGHTPLLFHVYITPNDYDW